MNLSNLTFLLKVIQVAVGDDEIPVLLYAVLVPFKNLG